MSKLLNEREAADFLRTSSQTLRTWRPRRRPKFIRLGAGKQPAIRYDRAELERFIEAGRVE